MFAEINNQKSVLVVDLKRLQSNYHVAKAMIKSPANCGAVVKANAYGLGIVEVCKALYGAGCRHFFVAYLSDAIGIKKLVQGAEIYVLNGFHKSEYEEGYLQGFIPVLNSISDIENYNHFASHKKEKLPAVLHLDTGMGRLGLIDNEFDYILKKPDVIEALNITYLMSHLACADELTNKLNISQLSKFKEAAKQFPNTKMSLCNSAGIYLGEEYHFDLVRAGYILYGGNPSPYLIDSPVQQVAFLYGRVVRIKTLDHDQTISYGGRYKAKKGDKIATITCGYADGYHRIMTGDAFCYFEKYKLPVIGVITMDMIMVDINSIPESKLKDLKYVELLGDNIKIEKLAQSANTIGYEVLTSLGNRFNRIYIE